MKLLRQVEVAVANGKTKGQAKEAEITEQTYYPLAQGVPRSEGRPGEAVEGVGVGERGAEASGSKPEPG